MNIFVEESSYKYSHAMQRLKRYDTQSYTVNSV